MGQQEYRVNFKIQGLKDTTCLIAYYYGKSTYVEDTLNIDGSGQCRFHSRPDLPKGMYILILPGKAHFDFILNNDYKISMETDLSDPVKHMKIKHSKENSLYYQYLWFTREQHEQTLMLTSLQKQVQGQTDSVRVLQQRVDRISRAVAAYKTDLTINNPDAFISFLINILNEPDIQLDKDTNKGNNDSVFQYFFFAAHYWDAIDLTDSRLLRTPVFEIKLEHYLSKVVFPVPDSILVSCAILLEKARPNQEVYRYVLWYLTRYYENSEIMGFDKVFVSLVDNYYMNGHSPWVDTNLNKALIEKANRLRPLLIGTKAPNLIMQDTSLTLISMYEVASNYLLLLFWDPDCGHCKVETEKVRYFYKSEGGSYGLKVFAVCTDTNFVKMKKAIKDRQLNWINVNGPRTLTGNFHDRYDIIQTPVLYLLNDKKEIVAKRFPADQLGTILKYDTLRRLRSQ